MIWTSIDPGCTGWAHWEGQYVQYLVACGVEEDVDAVPVRGRLIIERPQIYRGSKSKADPNDLITLAIQVGRYVERSGGNAALVTPAQWKGQVTKEIIVPRILGALNDGERAIATRASLDIAKGKVHNMIEAIGIGLHACGRMGRGGV